MVFLFQPWLDFKVKRQLKQLAMPEYSFLFELPPEQEWVSIDCETTGLDRQRDHILTIAAVKVVGLTVLSSQRLELILRPPTAIKPEGIRYHRLREADVVHGLSSEEATDQLLRFIGSRPLVGYNLKFDQDMLNRMLEPIIGVKLPNRMVDIAPMYHRLRSRQLGYADIDLRFDSIRNYLQLPAWPVHDAYNDALMTALIFLSLRERLKE